MNTTAQSRPPRRFRFPRVPVRLLDFALALAITASAVVLFAYSGIGGDNPARVSFFQKNQMRPLGFRFSFFGGRGRHERIVIVYIVYITPQKLGSFPIP